MYTEVHKGVPEGRLLVKGQGDLAQVAVSVVPTSLCLTEQQILAIEPAVHRLTEKGLVVTDGPTFRLESWKVGSRLGLMLSERSYFDSVLLKQNPQWGIRSQVLAVVCVTECLDGFVIERRSAKVASLPGHLHPTPSGSVEPPAHPLETLQAEALEELGLAPQELSSVLCLGLVFGELSGVYQLVCRATVSLTLEQISDRACSGEWERSELMCAPICPKTLPDWIAEHQELLTAGGRVALFLEGGRRWGDSWFEEQAL